MVRVLVAPAPRLRRQGRTVAVDTSDSHRRLQYSLRTLIHEAGGPANLITPRGYRHMGLTIVDAVFSLGARYDTVVVPLLKRYSEVVHSDFWDTKDLEDPPEHGAKELLETLVKIGTGKFEIFNRQKVRRRNRNHLDKVTVVEELAKKLIELKAGTTEDFRSRALTQTGFEYEVRSVPGVGVACYRYLCNLAQLQRIKPDTQVVAWANNALGSSHSPEVIARLLETVAETLENDLGVGIRQVDHLIWRKRTGRQLGRN